MRNKELEKHTFKVTIVDNQTGEIVHEEKEADCIAASIAGKDGVVGTYIRQCGSETAGQVATVLASLKDKIFKDPMAMLVSMISEGCTESKVLRDERISPKIKK